MKRPSRADLPSVLALATSLAALAFLLATAVQPLRLDWGDPWSDVDIRNAGHFFAKYGFWETRFAGIVDVEPLGPESYRYLHYPPLGMLINGVLQSVFRTDSLPLARVVATLVSASSLWFFFRYVTATFGRTVASYSVAVFAGNALWVKYADCIYSHPLHLATGFACLHFLARWLTEKRARDLVLSGVSAFFCFFASYDYFFFVPIAVVLTPPLLGQSVWAPASRRATLVVAAFCAASIATKCALAIWAVGAPAFLEDLTMQFFERATAKYTFEYAHSLPRITFWRLWHFFSPTVLVLPVIYAAAAIARVAKRAPAWLPSPGPLVLLVAGLPFVVAMSQLFAEQYHPSLSFLPFAAVAAAAAATKLLAMRVRAVRALGAALIAAPLAWSVHDLATSPKTFLHEEDLVSVRAYLDAHDGNSYIYSNLAFSATFRYALKRQLFPTTHMTPRELTDAVWGLQTELGVRAVHYLQVDDVERSAGDCKMGSYVATSFKRQDWLENPWSSRGEMEAAVRKSDDVRLAVLREIGEPVVSRPGMTLYRVDGPRFHQYLARSLPIPTTSVRFGDEASGALLIRGFTGPQPDNGGFRWLHPWPTKRLILKASGLVFVPTGDLPRVAQMLIRFPAGGDLRLEIAAWGAVDGQTMKVFVNDGRPVAEIRYEHALERKVVELVVPASSLEASGVQKLDLAYDSLSASGDGVAVQSLRVVDAL